MALGAAALQQTVPPMEEWLQITGQDVRVDKSFSWLHREQGALAALLRGVPIPLATTLCQLGVDIAIGGSKATGPALSRRLEAGRSALRRLPHLSTYDRRERAVSTLVTPLALHGVAVARGTEPDVRGLETAVVRALWGPPRVSRAKEVIFTVLSKGHRVSPIMPTRYGRLLWVARLARQPGVTQVFAQAIGESGGRPPGTGPVGRARRTAASLGWTLREGWWCWDIPGQEHPLRAGATLPAPTTVPGQPSLALLAPSGGAAPHHLRRAGRRGGWPGLPRALRAASTEFEKSLLHGLLWPGPCGRRPGCRATAREPTPRAPSAARRTRTWPRSCGTARNGTTPWGRGSRG